MATAGQKPGNDSTNSNPVAVTVASTRLQATLDGQLIAPFTIVGSCNRSVFETWLLTCLIPVLQPGEWVIVEHATFPERRSDCPIDGSGRLSSDLLASRFA